MPPTMLSAPAGINLPLARYLLPMMTARDVVVTAHG